MTEQENQVLLARLTRVWIPTRHDWEYTSEYAGHNWQLTNEYGRLEYRGYWPDRTRLTVGFIMSTGQLFFFLQFWGKGRYRSSMACRTNVSDITVEEGPEHRELIAQWLPRFRRNCWLCGCPLDASAHEKLEWMQGFTPEELGAWDLKF